MNTVFLVSERGNSFATRTRAAEIVQEICEFIELQQPNEITIDLTGVRVVSPSFAAAFINHLRSLLSRTKFQTQTINVTCDNALIVDRFKQALEQNIMYVTNSKPLNHVLIR